MLSLNNVGSAGQALHYFSKDNYYTQDEGLAKSEWFGKGAEALGLKGQIEREQFFDTLAGKVGGQELGKTVINPETGEREREHRPGIDLTFSAPKSVSLLAEVGGDREVREAHEAAVKKALTYLESELAQTRQMSNGELENVKTGNLVVAMFRHNTSRDLDPQTHTHAVVMNVTQREDGQWRSLTNEEIYRAQRTLGAIYTGELAVHLQKAGYELRRTDDKGNFEIVGVSREQIEHFSQRRAEIEASLKSRGIDIDGASAQEKETATLMTRAKKVDVDHDSLLEAWRERAKDVGLNLAEIQLRAAANREKGGFLREDQLSGRQAMEFAAAHLIEREAVVQKSDLLNAALEHGVGRVSPSEVEKAFNKLEAEGHLIKLPDGGYTTAKMAKSEAWSLEQVRAQKSQTARVMAVEEVAQRLEKAETKQGFKFTEGQRDAITKSLTSEDRFVAVQGLAGTGKTTMLKAMRELAEQEGYTVRGMAPTGAASKVLARETGIATDTVSMFQIKERELQGGIAFAKQYAPDFIRKAELWIVDESSFLSQRQKAQLDHLAIKAGAKVVYLGDSLQLQGVEAGKPFELAQKAGMQTAYMTEISRQKTSDLKAAVDIIVGRDQVAPGERITQAELKHNARAFEHLDRAGMVRENKDAVGTLVKDVLAMDRAERDRTLIITAFNKDRQQINEGIRAGMRAKGELGQSEQEREILVSKGWTRAMLKEAQYFGPGDVVRFGRDYQQLNAAKGEYMRVVDVDGPRRTVTLQKADGATIAWQPHRHKAVEVYAAEQRRLATGDSIRITRNEGEFKNGEIVKVVKLEASVATIELKQGEQRSTHQVDLNRNKHWDHAYASTVHSSQGATQYRAIFHIRAPQEENERRQQRVIDGMAKVFGDRSFYVGATRASHELKIYTNDRETAAQLVAGGQDKSSVTESLGRGEARTLGVSR
jgi:conjugative relaxase-like TrwC/TraI family protein